MTIDRRIDNRELIQEATQRLETKIVSRNQNLKRLKDNKGK